MLPGCQDKSRKMRSNIVMRESHAFTLLQNKILYAILPPVDCSARE